MNCSRWRIRRRGGRDGEVLSSSLALRDALQEEQTRRGQGDKQQPLVAQRHKSNLVDLHAHRAEQLDSAFELRERLVPQVHRRNSEEIHARGGDAVETSSKSVSICSFIYLNERKRGLK